MNLFSRLRCKLFLLRWSGVSHVGRTKAIRINRTYTYLQSNLLDLTWSLRKIKPNGTASHPIVITERVSYEAMEYAVNRIERNLLPKTLNDFAKKIGEEL